MNNDGAHFALAGYLYQIPGEWGLLAKAYVMPSASAHELSSLMAFTKSAKVTHEPDNPDLGLEGLDPNGIYERKFVQFKYSTVASPLDRNDLIAIAKSFLESTEKAKKVADLPTGDVLMTNRDLSASAEECRQLVKDDQADPLLGDPRLAESSISCLTSLVTPSALVIADAPGIRLRRSASQTNEVEALQSFTAVLALHVTTPFLSGPDGPPSCSSLDNRIDHPSTTA